MLRGLVPVGLRRAVSRCLPPGIQHRLSMKWANADIDWERTNAFCIPNANEGYVRINLAGREPRGRPLKGPPASHHAPARRSTLAGGAVLGSLSGELQGMQARLEIVDGHRDDQLLRPIALHKAG